MSRRRTRNARGRWVVGGFRHLGFKGGRGGAGGGGGEQKNLYTNLPVI